MRLALVIDQRRLHAGIAFLERDVGRLAQQQGFAFGADGAAIRRGEGGHRPQCLRAGVEGARERHFDVALAVGVGIGGGDALFGAAGNGFVVAAKLPARPRRIRFGEIAPDDAPNAIGQHIGRGRAVEPVGFKVKLRAFVVGLDRQRGFDLPRDDAATR